MKTFALLAILGLAQALRVTDDATTGGDDLPPMDDIPDFDKCDDPCADSTDDACWENADWDAYDECICTNYPDYCAEDGTDGGDADGGDADGGDDYGDYGSDVDSDDAGDNDRVCTAEELEEIAQWADETDNDDWVDPCAESDPCPWDAEGMPCKDIPWCNFAESEACWASDEAKAWEEANACPEDADWSAYDACLEEEYKDETTGPDFA